MQALNDWLSPETWYKEHPIDDGRFFVFVASVWSDVHRIWDEAAAREIIASHARDLHPGFDELSTKVAEKRVSQGTLILDFLSNLSEAQKLALLTTAWTRTISPANELGSIG